MSVCNLLYTSTPQSLKNRLSHNSISNPLNRSSIVQKYNLSSQSCSEKFSQPCLNHPEQDSNSQYFSTIPTNIIGNSIIITSNSKILPYQQYLKLQKQLQQHNDLYIYLSKFLKQSTYQEQITLPSLSLRNIEYSNFNSNSDAGIQNEEERKKLKSLSTALKGNFETTESDRFQEQTDMHQFPSYNTQVSVEDSFAFDDQSRSQLPYAISNDSFTHSRQYLTSQSSQDNTRTNHNSTKNIHPKRRSKHKSQLLGYFRRKFYSDLSTAKIVFPVIYIMYILICILFGSHLPALVSQLKPVSFLFLALATKIFFIANKKESRRGFSTLFCLCFLIDYLATHFYLYELINLFFANHIHYDNRLDISLSFRMSIGIICTCISFMTRKIKISHLLLNKGLTNSKVIFISVQQQKNCLMKNSKLALLSVVTGVLISAISEGYMAISSQSQNEIESSYSAVARSISAFFGCNPHNQELVCSFPWLVSLIYLFALSQVVLFSLATQIIINLKVKRYLEFSQRGRQ